MPLLFVLFFIGIAIALAWFLISHDHGEREPIGALWLALGFGFFGLLPTLFLERTLLHVSSGAASTASLSSMLGIGVIEEFCKFVPLAIYIYKKRYFNERTDGVIYFALAGIGFGLPENILYTLSFGASTGLGRIVLTPIFHAATTALVGYFFAKIKLERRPVWHTIIPLSAAMLLHGIYDYGLSSQRLVLTFVSCAITFGLSGALFVFFLRATTYDQEIGLSVVGNNTYCRSCGKLNAQHKLYCTYCGKNA